MIAKMIGTAKNLIRNFFTPTEENGAVPLGLTPAAFAFYLIVAVALVISPRYARFSQLASLARPALFGPSDLVVLVNGSRSAQGAPALTQNPVLQAAAQAKMDDMVTNHYFAHVSPTKKTPWDFIRGAGYHYVAAGENLAVDFTSAMDAHAALMNSPTHRANILNQSYTEIGVAVGRGDFEGRPTIFIAEYFGHPSFAPTVAKAMVGKQVASGKPVAKPAPPVEKTVPKETPQPKATTSAVAGVASNTAPKPPILVLGTETETSIGSSGVKNDLAVFWRGISFEDRIKTTLMLLIGLVFLPLFFYVYRTAEPAGFVIVRSFLILVLLGVIFAGGVPKDAFTHLTPSAPSEVQIFGQ